MDGTEQTQSNADSVRQTALAEFLLARIDEDEAWSKAADETPDAGGERWEAWSGIDGDIDQTWFVGGRGALWETEGSHFMGGSRVVMEHVARHDPARVLAECEAKRQIVDLAREARETQGAGYGTADAYMRDVLRLLALPHADHPDYDDGWRP